MTKITYVLNFNERTQKGNNSVWVVPMNDQKIKPYMTCKIVGGYIGLTALVTGKVMIHMKSRYSDVIASDAGQFMPVAYSRVISSSAIIEKNDISYKIKANPLEFEFGFFESNFTQIQYTEINGMTLIIECEYVDNEEVEEDYANLIKGVTNINRDIIF